MANVKAEVRKALEIVLNAEGKQLDKTIFDKAWGKYGREANNYGQTAAERADEENENFGGDWSAPVDTLKRFYQETENNADGKNTYNRKMARQYGKEITFNYTR